jgi:hypothetical protein
VVLVVSTVQKGPTPPFATLLGFHLLLFSHTRLETVGGRYGFGTFFSPNRSISSLRCTFLTYRCLWRGSLCHSSSFPNVFRNRAWGKQRWRNKSLSRNSLSFETAWKGQPSTGSHQCLCLACQLCESHDQWYQCLFIEFFSLLDAPNLPAFLGAKSKTTKENFSPALEEYVTSLIQAMTQEMLQDSVAAIHQEQ